MEFIELTDIGQGILKHLNINPSVHNNIHSIVSDNLDMDNETAIDQLIENQLVDFENYNKVEIRSLFVKEGEEGQLVPSLNTNNLAGKITQNGINVLKRAKK